MTIIEDDTYLFQDIDLEVQLPENYIMRPLKRNDYQYGFIELLAQLSTVGTITYKSYQDRFDLLKKIGTNYVIVIEDEHKTVVASATLLVEYKFLHECGNVGHIEDVVVHDSQRGKKLGIRLMDQLYSIAKQTKCYKVILNCKETNIPFYEKCQFKQRNIQMSRYF